MAKESGVVVVGMKHILIVGHLVILSKWLQREYGWY